MHLWFSTIMHVFSVHGVIGPTFCSSQFLRIIVLNHLDVKFLKTIILLLKYLILYRIQLRNMTGFTVKLENGKLHPT